MQKPLNIAYREFCENLQKVINTAELPAFMMLSVVHEATTQLAELSERQYQRDIEEWGKAVNSEDGEQTNQPV